MSADLRKPWHVTNEKGYWCLQEINKDGGSHSIAFATKEEAEAELARFVANGLCRECGDPINDRWIPEVKTQVLKKGLCHTCLFWTDYVNQKADPTHVVVKGYHYVIAPDHPNGYRGFVGHGGAEFNIKFNDGREVVSHNLWAQGSVPDHFRDRLPDTATFVQRGHVHIGAFAGYGGAGSADAEFA